MFLIKDNHISPYFVYVFLFSISIIILSLHICICALGMLLAILLVIWRCTPAIAVLCYCRYFYATLFSERILSENTKERLTNIIISKPV